MATQGDNGDNGDNVDFDSSDLDFEQPAHPRARLGLMSIKSMATTTREDRMSSKKYQKTMGFTLGAPSTVDAHSLWWNHLQSFRVDTLGKL